MKDEEINQERKDVEVFRMNLQRQVRQLEEELDMQRRELSSGFDEAMKRREKEYRTKIEELSAMALSHEMKVRQYVTTKLVLNLRNHIMTTFRDRGQ